MMKCRWHPSYHFTQTHLSHLPGLAESANEIQKVPSRIAFSLYYSILYTNSSHQKAPPSIIRFKLLISPCKYKVQTYSW